MEFNSSKVIQKPILFATIISRNYMAFKLSFLFDAASASVVLPTPMLHHVIPLLILRFIDTPLRAMTQSNSKRQEEMGATIVSKMKV